MTSIACLQPPVAAQGPPFEPGIVGAPQCVTESSEATLALHSLAPPNMIMELTLGSTREVHVHRREQSC